VRLPRSGDVVPGDERGGLLELGQQRCLGSAVAQQRDRTADGVDLNRHIHGRCRDRVTQRDGLRLFPAMAAAATGTL